MVVMLHASNEYYTAIYQPHVVLEPAVAAYWWTATVYKFFTLSCVPIFIMLSGALLLQSSKSKEPIKVFLKKRAKRLGWAFAFWSVIYLVWGFVIYEIPWTFDNVFHGVLWGVFTGPWYHFWFLYLIAGLYLITPVLRAVVANKDHKLLRYLIILWFVGEAVVPLVNLATGYTLNSGVFIWGGCIGYFVLGEYLKRVRARPAVLYGFLFIGFIWTVSSTWAMHFVFPALEQYYFFFDYLSANVIITSVALYMILSRFKPDWPGNNHPRLRKVVQAISKNTLPIYLFHVIILMSLQRGFFGVTLSLTTINPIIGVPLIATVTFLITVGLVLIMKKIPVLKTLIG
jgi:surface polysaccharide O-acyltransferase-like enzyme